MLTMRRFRRARLGRALSARGAATACLGVVAAAFVVPSSGGTTAAAPRQAIPDVRLVRVTPDWRFDTGWEAVGWGTSADASRIALVRGTDRIVHPQPNWRTRDLFLLERGQAPRHVYGPDAGGDGDPISRIEPAVSADGETVVFGTYRQAYPQGTDLRRWTDRGLPEVAFGSGQNFDLDFPAVSRHGETLAFVEIMPLTADNHVFRSRLRVSRDGAAAEVKAEYPNRHITGLAASADGTAVVFCLQDFSDDPDRGEIRRLGRDDAISTLLTYEGVAGPVAVSADGRHVAAYSPRAPLEMGASSDASPGVYLWRDGASTVRIDADDGTADLRVPLTMSADGTRVSWAGVVWTEGAGVEPVFQEDPGPGVETTRMSADGRHWTAWLERGPDGPGLYRLEPGATDEPRVLLPLAVR